MEHPQDQPPELLTLQEVAAYLRLTEKAVRRRIERGEIPYLKAGGSLRFRRDEIDVWLEAGRKGAA